MPDSELLDEEPEIRVVLDTTAILSYARGHVHVGEMIVDIMDEGAHVGLPTVALLDAHSRISKQEQETRARIGVLAAMPGVVVLALGPDEAVAIPETVSRFDDDGNLRADYDLARAFAAWVAVEHHAYYLTSEPDNVPAVLADWQVHYISHDDA
jgi:hypothetical protein